MTTRTDPMIDPFHQTGGTVPQFGRNLVVMHAFGARSGEPRTRAARGIPFRGGWVTAATAGGQPTEPLWAANLRAHPDIRIEVPLPEAGIESLEVHTSELEDPLRAEAWRLFLEASPNFAIFEQRTTRRFPIFHFTPR